MMRYAFSGDRDISVAILKLLIENGHPPVALMVTESSKASHSEELIKLSRLEDEFIFRGNEFREEKNIEILKNLELDYILGIHFPYLIPAPVLDIPKIGFLNLHPAYLPYNKGWHTPSWAIIEGTPYGATLHFMSVELDKGDIISQKECRVLPSDTADSLYQRVKKVEVELFEESLPLLVSLNPPKNKQITEGTSHFKKQLSKLQLLNGDEPVAAKDLINKLRALTTNRVDEAVYFINDGKKYFVQVNIVESNL